MKSNSFLAALVATSVMAAGCAPKMYVKHLPEPGKKMRVAVLPFKDAPGRPGTGALATESFTTQIMAVDAYEVVERSALNQILKEQKLGMSGVVDASNAVDIGKLLGADAVVLGAVTEFQERWMLMFPPAKVSVTARLINTQTGRVDWSAQHRVGGAKRWLSWIIVPVGVLATATSPSAQDQLDKAAKRICKALQLRLR